MLLARPLHSETARRTFSMLLAFFGLWAEAAAAEPPLLDRCLAVQDMPRVARVMGRDGSPWYVTVTSDAEGVPTAVSPLASGDLDLRSVLERTRGPQPANLAQVWKIGPEELASRVCAPVPLSQEEIEAEERLVVAAGLNYAAHAEESGGGDVFIFPKPVAPTPPYGALARPEDVELLDYEVELGFVLLEDVELGALPTPERLLEQSAFFVLDELTDRAPIIREKAFSGPGTGFVKAKGRPGFLPIGPWLVRGSELFAALEACGDGGLGLTLAVDEGEGFRVRQSSTTARMILDPLELLERIAREVERRGLRTSMPIVRNGTPRHYPIAVDESAPRLPAGSLILTGTPEGVAIQAPSSTAVVLRGLLHLRGPFAQFLAEERERAAAGGPGGYLDPGDRVRAGIDGLGTQSIRIVGPRDPVPPDPCGVAKR